MITLKEWNKLSDRQRERVCREVFHDSPEWYQAEMAKEWHHKLDADHRLLLSCIFNRNGYYTYRAPEIIL